MLSPHLPEILGADELLKVLGRNGLKLFNQAQHPDNLLGLLGTKGVQKLFDRAVTSLCPVEVDLTHPGRLTQT